ncbi:MAG: putative Fe-S cluster assembly protein SufT [Opitutales bacterium]|nr:putative Fe-S cluster assembly protein SufT [Opitutales bacterium]MCH8539253.1 putative Fe-S cluster assembly protein SufT [Opitutales bacterium]
MIVGKEIELLRDCPSTIIPAGDPITLPKGKKVFVSQALGGTVTVRAEGGLFRIAGKDLDALGEDVVAEISKEREKAPPEASGPVNEGHVWEAMKACFDPEIPINIVDLGLIYDLRLDEGETKGQKKVSVKMTLTAQGCGMGPVIAEDAKTKIEALPGVESAEVEIVWDPVWNPQMISEEGRKKLGING